jgi:hypothetical protein
VPHWFAGLKLLAKESLIPTNANLLVFLMALPSGTFKNKRLHILFFHGFCAMLFFIFKQMAFKKQKGQQKSLLFLFLFLLKRSFLLIFFIKGS